MKFEAGLSNTDWLFDEEPSRFAPRVVIAGQVDLRHACVDLQQSADVLDQVETDIRDFGLLKPAANRATLQGDWLSAQSRDGQCFRSAEISGEETFEERVFLGGNRRRTPNRLANAPPEFFSRSGMILWRMRFRVGPRLALLASSRKVRCSQAM